VCAFLFVWFVYVTLFFPDRTQYIFPTPMAWYSLFVLKVPLSTNQSAFSKWWCGINHA